MAEKTEKIKETAGKKSKVIDTIAKILCVLGAFALWFYVMQNDITEYEETIAEVPVSLVSTEYIEERYNLSVYRGYGNVVDVTVVGQKGTVTKLTADDVRVYVDLASITESGNYSLDIKAELPDGVTLSGLSYNTVSVYTDVKEVKTVDVKAEIISISVPSQYEIGKLEPSVDSITVTGPRSALENIEYASVGLSLGSVTSSTTAIGQLTLVDKNDNDVSNPYIRLSRSEVTVKVPVYTYKTVPIEYSFKYGYLDSSNSDVTCEPSSVKLKGDPSVLDGISSVSMKPIDERLLASNDVTITQSLILPDGVTAVDGADTASVKIHMKNLVLKTLTLTKISVMGATVPYRLVDTKTTVTVRVTSDVLDLLDEDNLIVLLDLTGYTPDNTYTMEIEGSVMFPSNLGSIFVVEPPTVKVQFN